MNSILNVLGMLFRVWPLALGLSLTWFLLGLWGGAPLARSSVPVQEAKAAVSGLSRGDQILSKNILRLDNPAPVGPSEGPNPSSWKLIGIIVGDKPMVLLLIDGKAKTVRVGEQESGWVLDAVQANTAVFRSGAVQRTLTLFKDATPVSTPKGSKSKINLSKSEIAPVLTDPGNLLQQALFKPNIEDSKTVGYRIDNIQDNSILKRLGFQNGDILMRINGEPIDGPGKMMQLYSGLQSAKAVNMDIRRGTEFLSFIVELN